MMSKVPIHSPSILQSKRLCCLPVQPNQWPSGLTIEACLRYRIGTGTLNLDTTDLSKVAISTTAINKGEKKTTGQQPSSSSTKIDPETICCKTSGIFGWKLTSQKSQNFILKLLCWSQKQTNLTPLPGRFWKIYYSPGNIDFDSKCSRWTKIRLWSYHEGTLQHENHQRSGS